MKSYKIKLFTTLVAVGLIGVVSLLFSDSLVASLPPEVTAIVPAEVLSYLLLVNPAIFVIVATAIGVLLHDKVNLSVPLFEKLLKKPNAKPFSVRSLIVHGIIFGLVAGVALVVINMLFRPFLPPELIADSAIDTSIITKLLYGGVTEELLMRFGVMTLITWLIFKLTKKLTAPVYWTAIVLSSIIFAIGHLPAVFLTIADPTLAVISYVIIGNSIGGMIFGYAYWRKGLESAMIAHMFAHVVMMVAAITLG